MVQVETGVNRVEGAHKDNTDVNGEVTSRHEGVNMAGEARDLEALLVEVQGLSDQQQAKVGAIMGALVADAAGKV